MKTLILTLFLLLFSGFVCYSQSNSIPNNGKLKTIDEQIVQINNQIIKETSKKEELLKTYREKHPVIVEANIKIKELYEKLSVLNKEKDQILAELAINNLPDNQIELLKIIISQNEKIIKLLEKLQKP